MQTRNGGPKVRDTYRPPTVDTLPDGWQLIPRHGGHITPGSRVAVERETGAGRYYIITARPQGFVSPGTAWPHYAESLTERSNDATQ